MRYEIDILADEPSPRQRGATYPIREVALGMVVEDRASGYVGDIVRWNHAAVTLRDRRQHVRSFTWKPGGFLLEGRPVTLTVPKAVPSVDAYRLTASGSIAGDSTPRQARASRIWVEGIQDAELVEHIWGDDLRQLGVAVEPMHGADRLADAVAEFAPTSDRRFGVLLDHLVPGSKESRLAASVRAQHVLIAGHPFVDVWAGVRPRLVGRDAWPEVAPGRPWKAGVCEALGVDQDRFWPTLRNRVRTYADLEPELVGAVERLIDFVSAEARPHGRPQG